MRVMVVALLALVGCDAFTPLTSRRAVMRPAATRSVRVRLAADGEKKAPTAEDVMEAYRAIDEVDNDASAAVEDATVVEEKSFGDLGCAAARNAWPEQQIET